MVMQALFRKGVTARVSRYLSWGTRILLYCDGVEMAFDPSSIPHFKGNKHGTVYLTTHRHKIGYTWQSVLMVEEKPKNELPTHEKLLASFLTYPHWLNPRLEPISTEVIFNNLDKKDMLQSFSLSFGSMREVELEQPVFGANYIKGKMLAELGGNWSGAGRFKMWFKNGGAIEFGQAMLRAGQLASRNRQSFNAPPAYTPPQGPFYQAPPPAYSAPHTEYYAWVPYQTFPTAPPASSVYMTEAPPPYPGIDPNFTPYPPPPQQNGYPPNSKASEAAAASSAYYNPSYPHNVYMPSAPPPPSYDEVTKKYN